MAKNQNNVWYKTWWGIILIVFGSLIVLSIIVGSTGNNCETNSEDKICPALDCSTCSVKTETKIETKIITEKIYVCQDLTETSNKDDCKTEEQKTIENSDYALVITINNFRTARSISNYSLENLKSDEQYLIVDFSIYNKELENGWEFNPNFVQVEDSEGYSYSYSWDSPSLSKYWGGMTGVTVEHNVKKSGELAFVIPKSEKNFTLVVRNFFGVVGKVQFDLD